MSAGGVLGIQKTRGGGTDHWQRRWEVGRFGFHLLLMRHNSPTLPDRWVFQPQFVYDRKGARGC